MSAICQICAADPMAHSFKKVAEKRGTIVYYSKPSQAKRYDDTEGILEHIDKTMAISKINPAKAFENFCSTNMDEITDEIFRLKQRIILKRDEITMKFKKSYKNRFYKIRISLNH